LAGRPSSQDPSPSTDTRAATGLGEQFGRTRSAVLGLVAAHVNLAKAEFSEIGGQVKRALVLGGCALALLFFAGILLSVGLLLFFGEAVFGSLGWGVLDGTLLLLGVAAVLVLAIVDLGLGRLFAAFIVAVLVALVVGTLLAIDWAAFSRDHPGTPGALALALLAGAVLIGILGLLLAASFGGFAAGGGLVIGAILGLLLGWLASAGPDLRVAVAVGLAAGLLLWPISAAVLVFRHGVDMDKLRARFVPEQTIATTKETIEWVREQMPLGRKS
jgi:uncharacterized membrane protein YqjE